MHPPSVPSLPVLGNAVPFIRDPLGFLCGTRLRFGDVARVRLGSFETALVSHPDLVEEILVSQNRRWKKDKFVETLRPVLGEGLLSSDGDFWRRQRRLAQPAFHKDRIASYGTIMVEYAAKLAGQWKHGEVRDVHSDMMRLTLDIVAATLFGANVEDHAEAVGHALHAVATVVGDPLELMIPILRRLPTPQRVRFDRAVATLDSIIYGVIDAREKNGDDNSEYDLLSMLLGARDDDGGRMSKKQLRDECMTLFLAGHETTALALSWTWLLLSQHRGATQRLVKELDEVLGDRLPTMADLPNLKFTGHVITESLRMYPPAWSIGREAIDDVDVGGFLIKQGEDVMVSPWAMQRDARFYDDPHSFRPARWENDFGKTLPKYAYFPFGGGPRFCIGQQFALMEAVLLLATLAKAFDVDVQGKRSVKPQPSVTLRPKGGLTARLTRRLPRS